MKEPPFRKTVSLFQSRTLLMGVLVGLVMLAWAGRMVCWHNWHPDFYRFHPLLALESNYQPTVAEMRAIVRSHCRSDQILVIIGGNSIFQGVGQPVEKLWTRRLQELLGDHYAVVNLAFRGSSITDGGAMVAESLRNEFPHQIYVANTMPFNAASAAGSLDYRFMVLDALHKGWLLDHEPRMEVIADYLERTDVYPRAREINLSARIDSWLYFRELWNWWSCTHFFTFPGPLTESPERAFRPRNRFADTETNFEAIPFKDRFNSRFFEAEMDITRNMSPLYYSATDDGGWASNTIAQSQFRRIASEAFPESLKSRTLIVLSRNSPYYTKKLTIAEQARDELAYRDSITIWHSLGYDAMEYGTSFQEVDFGDRTHLTASGGKKLAVILAPEIEALAMKLNYPSVKNR